jgi:hypothetical protein
MNHYFNNITKTKYKDYEIDDTKTSSIFNELFEICDFFEHCKLEYTITGSCATILHTNTIYRTIGDIDIIIDLINLEKCIKALSKKGYNLLSIGKNPILSFKINLTYNHPIVFYNSQKQIKLEILVVYNNHEWYVHKKTLCKKINNKKYYYSLPLKFKKLEKFFYNRVRDFDDLDFYLPLINK